MLTVKISENRNLDTEIPTHYIRKFVIKTNCIWIYGHFFILRRLLKINFLLQVVSAAETKGAVAAVNAFPNLRQYFTRNKKDTKQLLPSSVQTKTAKLIQPIKVIQQSDSSSASSATSSGVKKPQIKISKAITIINPVKVVDRPSRIGRAKRIEDRLNLRSSRSGSGTPAVGTNNGKTKGRTSAPGGGGGSSERTTTTTAKKSIERKTIKTITPHTRSGVKITKSVKNIKIIESKITKNKKPLKGVLTSTGKPSQTSDIKNPKVSKINVPITAVLKTSSSSPLPAFLITSSRSPAEVLKPERGGKQTKNIIKINLTTATNLNQHRVTKLQPTTKIIH